MMTTQQPSTVRSQRWRWLVGGLIFIVLVLAALPEALRWGAQRWLNQQPGLTATLADVDLNLFRGTLQLQQLQVERGDELVLSAGRARLQLDWWPLLHRQLQFRHLQVEQGRLLIEQVSARPLTVAGLVLAAGDAGKTSDPAAPPPAPTQPWGINSGTLDLQQFEIVLRTDQQDMAVVIDRLAGSPVISWQPQQPNSFDIALSLAGGSVRLLGQSQPFAAPNRATVELQIDQVDLATLAPLLAGLGWSDGRGVLSSRLMLDWRAASAQGPAHLTVEGTLAGEGLSGSQAALWLRNLGLSWDGRVALQLSDGTAAIDVAGRLQLDGADFDLLQPGMRIQSQQVKWQGALALQPGITADEGDGQQHWNVGGALQADQLKVVDLTLDQGMLALDQLRVTQFGVPQRGPIQLQQLALQQLSLLQRKAPAQPRTDHVVQLATLGCDRIAFTPGEQLAVGELRLRGLQADLVRLSSGAMEWQQWLPVEPPSAASDPAAANASSPLGVSLQQVTVDGDSWLRFEDQGTTRPVALALSPLSLTLGALDSRQPQVMSPVSLQGRFDLYSELEVRGAVAPFAAQPTFDVSGTVSQFQLPTVSPYVELAAGYRLEQGQLNLDFALPVSQGRMALDSELHFRQLRLAPLSAEDEAAVGERLGLPVNMALSLLRDRNGDIFLKLPVTGDLNDPNVAIGPVMRKALRGAVQNTVLLTLAPLGVAAKAGQLVGLGEAMKFDPLTCEAGTVELSPAALAQLDKVRQLLQERPQLSLSLCGRVSQADVAAMQTAAQQKVVAQASAAQEQPPAPAIAPEQLLDLARRRAEGIKAALVASGDVQPGQLLLCNPSAELADGVGGVELSL